MPGTLGERHCLRAASNRVAPILADGATETHGDAELRLLRLVGARHPDLFQTRQKDRCDHGGLMSLMRQRACHRLVPCATMTT